MNERMETGELVQLVTEEGEPAGAMEKLEAHRSGALHRAFSIFLFDDAGCLLMQRRAATKYHSAGLWTNTCCGHPRPGEDLAAAARRRLREEMGIDTELDQRFSFIYHAVLGNGLQEHELDHVFFGRWNKEPRLDPGEADDWAYVAAADLESRMLKAPQRFTVWLRTCWSQVKEEARKLAADA